MNRRISSAAALLALSSLAFGQNLILNGQNIPLNPNQPVTISPSTGDVSVVPQDTALQCGIQNPLTLAFNGRQAGGGGALVANPTITANTAVELQWSVNPTSGTTCVPTGGEGGWSSLASAFIIGNTSWTSPALANTTGSNRTVAFTLSCTNGPQSQQRTVNVTILPQGQGPNCASFPPPQGTTLQPNPSTFAQAFGEPFPLSVGNHNQLNAVNSGSYVALRFTALSDADTPRIDWLWEAPQSVPGAPSTMAISQCPGDFTNRNNGCFSTDNAIGGMSISHRNDGLPFSCDLQPGQEYYVNFIHATVSNGGLGFTQCRDQSTGNPRPSCGVELTHNSPSSIEGIIDELAEIELFRILLDQRRRAAGGNSP